MSKEYLTQWGALIVKSSSRKNFLPIHPRTPIKKEEEEEERQTPPGRKIDRISFFHPVLQDIIKGY